MRKTFVLRTEATLASENSTLRFGEDNTIVIPMAILENLYKYKGLPEKERMANKFIEYIGSIPMNELLSEEGHKQNNGSYLRVVDNSVIPNANIRKLQNISKLDERVYQVCLDLQNKGETVILISQSPIIRLKATKIGIVSEPFKDDIFPKPKDQYKGYIDVQTSKEVLDKLYTTGKIDVCEIYDYQNFEWYENLFLKIQAGSSRGLGRYTNEKVVLLKYSKHIPGGNKALNVEQTLLWECLLAPVDIAPLVVVKGAAGTGKTYCALVMALEKLKNYADEGIFDQLLVATPTVTVSDEEIGFLPGEIDNKVGPYLGGIMDNLKGMFRVKNPDLSNKQICDMAQELFSRGFIEIQPIGFLRGRTIPNTVFIIDEVQNIAPSVIKDIVTRAAKGSKFIFLGDPDQVNNPELNSRYNGLVYLSEKMKGQKVCWQVTLNSEKSVRGELAQVGLGIL